MKKIILIILTFLYAGHADACSCGWGGSFLELCPSADVVAKIKILGYEDYYEHPFAEDATPLTLVAEAIAVYKGKIESSEIRFRGDGGMSCLKYVEQFIIGKDYFILYHYEKIGEYPGLGVCGEFDVEINNERTVEREYLSFWESHTSVTYVDDFEDDILYTLNQCANESVLPEDNLALNPQTQSCEPEVRILKFVLLCLGAIIIFIFIYSRYKKKKNCQHSNKI
ncbi:MAG: hypothetical protein GQ574_08080 [Crocinitomix sp.]|nr:hypothetical protein [Crocinitomix sp.]